MPKDESDLLNDDQPPSAGLIGFRAVSASPDEVVAELVVTEVLTNANGVMHGGAIMAFADHLGGLATIVNLRVTSHVIVGPLLEELRSLFLPVLERVDGRLTLQH